MDWRTLNQYNKELNGLSAIDWFKNGYAFQNAGNYKQAIEAYSRAIELDPNDAKAYSCRGIAYNNLGDHRQAIRDYDRAIELDPKYAWAYVGRGNAYFHRGDDEQAIRDYDRAISEGRSKSEAGGGVKL